MSEIEILPAIIGSNFSEVKEKISRIGELSSWIHLDIADGLFVNNHTWQTAEDLQTLGGSEKIEAHLMLEQPEQVIPDWLAVADRIIIHQESTDQLDQIMAKFSSVPSKLGLALLLETPLEVLTPYLKEGQVDFIQLMSIGVLGHHGEPFAEQVLARISALRAEYPNVKISVDGGINLVTGKQCLEAGANQLVIGSALWKSPDPTATLHSFYSLISS